jgi:hypothetical protein
MDEDSRTQQDADAINEQMVQQIEERRRERPDRRQRTVPLAADRRRVCSYCFQPGDHPTAKDCLRALER